MSWFKCNLVDANVLDFPMLFPHQASPGSSLVFSTGVSANMWNSGISIQLKQSGRGTPSASNPRDYGYTEQIVLTHKSTPAGGSQTTTTYTFSFKFKVFAGTLYPQTGQLTTTLYGVDMGLLTYTQRSTGVLQVTKDSILAASGKDIARYNAAAVYCPVATINSQTTNQIRFNSDVTAANAASTFSGHYLIYELATGIFDASLGSNTISLTANASNEFSLSGTSSVNAYMMLENWDTVKNTLGI